MIIKCPVHGGEITLKPSGACPQCDANLAPWLRLKELPEVYYAEGVNLREKGSIEEAIEKIVTALNLNPNYVEAYIELADLYLHKGLYNDAKSKYKKALEVNPDNDDATKGLEKTKTLESHKKRKRIFTYIVCNTNSFIAGIGVTFAVIACAIILMILMALYF